MNPLLIYGAIGAGWLASLSGAHLTGRWLGYAKAERDIALAAPEEKDADDAVQAQTASTDSTAIRNDIARLRRLLAERNANDTAASACGLAGESDSVLDAHAEIFETGLPALPGLDGE